MSVNKLCKFVEKFEKLANEEEFSFEEEESDFAVSVSSACHRLMDAAKKAKLSQEEQDSLLVQLAELTLKVIHSA